MSELRIVLENARKQFPVPEMPFGGLIRRRDRKRRNQRIVAGAIGLALTVAAILAGTRLTLHGARPATPTPAPATTGQLLRHHGEVALVNHRWLVAVDVRTGHRRQLASCSKPCVGLSALTWSPDGRWIAYDVATCLRDLPCASQQGIWLKGARGDPRQVMSQCYGSGCYSAGDTSFSWSPDGARLAYVQPGDGESSIEVLDPSTFGRTRLIRSTGDITNVRWSPTGTRIAYVLDGEVHAMNADGSDRTALAGLAAGSLQWSPDGRRIVTEVQVEGRDQVWVANADGSGRILLVDEPLAEGPSEPIWSPDGSKLAYISTPRDSEGFDERVWVVSPDGSSRELLYESVCCIEGWADPVWSPDGTRVGFLVSLPSQGLRWFASRADGKGAATEIAQLTALAWGQRP